nr:proline--trna ligase, chloroplastic/mitochondrial [Quercus suber]
MGPMAAVQLGEDGGVEVNDGRQGTAAAETASEEQQVDSNAKSQVNPDRDRVITPWLQDFNAWYLDVIANTELVDYGPVKFLLIFGFTVKFFLGLK